MVYRLAPLTDKKVLCCGPLGLKLTCAITATVALTCAGLMTYSISEQLKEEAKIKELTERLNVQSVCKVVGFSLGVEERTQEEDAGGVDPKGCDGELCRTEYRSWVEVEYRAGGLLMRSKAWSHLDESWESEEAVVEEFLDKFARPLVSFPCWYDAEEPEDVRLWAKHSSRFCKACPSFWVPVGLLSLWACLVLVFVATKIESVPATSRTTDYSNWQPEQKPKRDSCTASNPLKPPEDVKNKPPPPPAIDETAKRSVKVKRDNSNSVVAKHSSIDPLSEGLLDKEIWAESAMVISPPTMPAPPPPSQGDRHSAKLSVATATTTTSPVVCISTIEFEV